LPAWRKAKPAEQGTNSITIRTDMCYHQYFWDVRIFPISNEAYQTSCSTSSSSSDSGGWLNGDQLFDVLGTLKVGSQWKRKRGKTRSSIR
jgi:hypothetical protein